MFMKDFDYFECWYGDRESVLETMKRNMLADIDAGYDTNGNCIKKQREEISLYALDIQYALRDMRVLTPEQTQHWCYIDLVRRGSITP